MHKRMKEKMLENEDLKNLAKKLEIELASREDAERKLRLMEDKLILFYFVKSIQD